MATKVTFRPNNIRTTSTNDKSVFQSPKCDLTDLRRLSTFNSINGDMHPTLKKGLLAKIGFVHTGQNIIKCDACGFEIELSTPMGDLIEEHMNQSPECQFVLNSNDIYTKNGMKTIFIVISLNMNIFHVF